MMSKGEGVLPLRTHVQVMAGKMERVGGNAGKEGGGKKKGTSSKKMMRTRRLNRLPPMVEPKKKPRFFSIIQKNHVG